MIEREEEEIWGKRGVGFVNQEEEEDVAEWEWLINRLQRTNKKLIYYDCQFYIFIGPSTISSSSSFLLFSWVVIFFNEPILFFYSFLERNKTFFKKGFF
jgi:hypothetical protein